VLIVYDEKTKAKSSYRVRVRSHEGKWMVLLTKPSFSSAIQAMFCDDAHCVEIWGGGVELFCQSYSKLAL